MANLVTFCKALADDTRWRIVSLVRDEALCVCELADILKMPQSSISSHVQIIRKAGLLESERCGKWTYFRIEPGARKALLTLENLLGEASGKTTVSDRKRAEARLKQRADSCCPGPVTLVALSRPRTRLLS